FARPHVVPVQYGQQGTMIAMPGVAEHPPNQPHISKLGETLRGAVALIKDVLVFDVNAELGGGIDPFCYRRIHTVKAIEQENLMRLESHRLARRAPPFLDTVNGLVDRLAVQ